MRICCPSSMHVFGFRSTLAKVVGFRSTLAKVGGALSTWHERSSVHVTWGGTAPPTLARVDRRPNTCLQVSNNPPDVYTIRVRVTNLMHALRYLLQTMCLWAGTWCKLEWLPSIASMGIHRLVTKKLKIQSVRTVESDNRAEQLAISLADEILREMR